MISKQSPQMFKSIPSYFREAACKYKNQNAVTDTSGSLTYGELDIRSEIIANYIINNKLKGNITVLMERTNDCIVTMLGILKSGCTYMYVDKNYPIQRINYMIKDSNSSLIICDDKKICSQKWINKCVEFNEIYDTGVSSIKIDVKAADAAYLIYTSGSTGNPKGLAISHGNFISLFETWGREHFILKKGAQVKTAVIAPLGFDMCVLMIYTSLFLGYNLHIIAEDEKKSGEGIIHFLDRYEIDIMDATPNYLRLIDNYLQCNSLDLLNNVSKIFCIGDVLNYQLAKNIVTYAAKSKFQLYNTYGPAECTVLMTFYIMNKENIEEMNDVPIGRVTPNAEIMIVDEELNHVETDIAGELIILGECVGLGYIGTNIKGSNPFNVFSTKSYRTGDLVKINSEGVLRFVGRVDRQCKINGYRIELEEIEKELESLAGVKEARIVAAKQSDGFVKLFAFYTGVVQTNLKEELKCRLPYYMVPQEIVYCSAFPITDNGKIDYKCLIANVEYGENQSKVDIRDYALKSIQKLLGIADLDLNKSFFQQGGDSITLLALVSDIFTKFKVKIDIAKLYTYSNLHELVEYFCSLKLNEMNKKDFKKNNIELPIIEPQKKLYTLERRKINSKNSVYNENDFSLLYKIVFCEPISVKKLEDAFAQVMKKSEVFSIRIKNIKNKLLMYKDRMIPVTIRQGKNEKNALEELEYISFDSIPFIKIIQYKQTILYINIKHLYLDFISVQYLLDDVIKLYSNGEEPRERIGFMEYIKQNNFCEENIIHYWKNKLLLCPKRTTIVPDKKVEKTAFKVIRYTCKDEVLHKIKKHAQKQYISNFIILLSFFVNSIKYYSKQKYIGIGCYCPGRNYELDNGTLGMLTNVLPFICNTESSTSLVEIVKQEVLDMLNNQNISQSKLYQCTSLEEISDGELFDICFNYQNSWLCMEDKQSGVARIETININPDITGRSFYFGVIEENNEMVWEISYNAGMYSADFILNFLNGMEREILNESIS